MLKDRMLILDLVEEGKITVSDAVEIIESIAITDECDTAIDIEPHHNEICLHFHIE